MRALAMCRPEELAELRRRDVDLDAGSIWVRRAAPELNTGRRLIGDPKSHAGKREIVLPAFVLVDVRRHLEWFAKPGSDGLVFVGEKGAALRGTAVGRKWRKARDKVGLPKDFRFYDLRHTGNTLAALLIFGALLTPQLFGDLSLGGYVAVVLAIVLIRPTSLLLSLVGTHFDRREKLAAAWFGPKGFASVVYGLLVLQSGIPQAEQAYTLIAVCIAFSIVAHSSTDVPVARMFRVNDLVGTPDAADAESNDVPEQRGADRART